MRKSFLAGSGSYLGAHNEEERHNSDALMLLFLFADEEAELDLDARALELAQLQLSNRQVILAPRRRRTLPARRHLRS